jgi:hypothetical protein
MDSAVRSHLNLLHSDDGAVDDDRLPQPAAALATQALLVNPLVITARAWPVFQLPVPRDPTKDRSLALRQSFPLLILAAVVGPDVWRKIRHHSILPPTEPSELPLLQCCQVDVYEVRPRQVFVQIPLRDDSGPCRVDPRLSTAKLRSPLGSSSGSTSDRVTMAVLPEKSQQRRSSRRPAPNGAKQTVLTTCGHQSLGQLTRSGCGG